ncbi:MAG: PHB depolymerase family esterase [Polyangiaceae bacterium]
MTAHDRASRILAWCVLAQSNGCTRADLYPITDAEPVDDPSNPPALTCPSAALDAGDTSRVLRVGGQERSYVLHVPTTYDPSQPSPLVVDFHGIRRHGDGQLASSPYPAVTDQRGVVIAFPDGMSGPIGTGWNMGPCCVANVDDLAFARALVKDVRSTACIDPKRIYAIGVLTGGGMAQHLACHAADVFAAIAPAAFDLLAETVEDCVPSRPVSVISFRGTADTHVPYAGGASTLIPTMPITFLGARESFSRWATINGCLGQASSEDDSGCSTFSACSSGVSVTLCTKEDGREEPGDPNVAWPFLEKHTLP